MEKSSSTSRPVTLISGCRGLATTLIRNFQSEGHHLSVLVRRPEAAAELQHEVPEALVQVGNLDSLESCQRWIQSTLERFGHIDHLINNAAITGPVGRLHEIEIGDYQNALRVNLLAPTYLCQLVLRHWEATQTTGVIINMSGGGATGARPHFSGYAVSKCALVRLTDTLAAEYPHHRFYAVSPGLLKTPLVEAMLDLGREKVGPEYEETRRRYEAGGENPERAALLMKWLCQNRPKKLNGRLVSAIWDDYKEFPEDAPPGWWTLRRMDEVCRKSIPNMISPSH